jgi:hypothetical protein
MLAAFPKAEPVASIICTSLFVTAGDAHHLDEAAM